MWPFIKNEKRKRDPKSEELKPRRRPLSLEQLVEGMGDCTDLADNDIALKFWLPEPAKQAIKELADIQSKNMSRMLRDFLLTHCYGVYALEWLREYHPGIFSDHIGLESLVTEELPPNKVRVHTYFVPELGKNIAAMKIWIPSRLKDELGILAEHMDLTTSNYVREIVISRFLGHGTLPLRPKMLDVTLTSSAEDWNENKDVPWKKVSVAEYRRAEVRKEESIIVDRK